MPNVLLSVPHFKQTQDGFCLPVCISMVLTYWKHPKLQTDLIRLLDTQSFGTPISHALRLKEWGFEVDFSSINVNLLKTYLEANKPVIVRLWTAMLDYWQIETSHVVVVTADRSVIASTILENLIKPRTSTPFA